MTSNLWVKLFKKSQSSTINNYENSLNKVEMFLNLHTDSKLSSVYVGCVSWLGFFLLLDDW
jgi:hypothetical protein